MNKTCNQCGISKPETEFYWQDKSKGKRLSICIVCRKANRKVAWADGREKKSNYASKKRNVERLYNHIWSVLESASCADCGFDNPVALEFDHVRGEKIADVFRMVGSNYGLDAIRAEIAKCEIVCANCHKIRTSTRGNHWRVVKLTTTS